MGKMGESVERREDAALITGDAEYLDDISEPGMAYMAVLRSQYARAGIDAIDTARAEDMGDVIDVVTWDKVEQSDAPGIIPVGTSLSGGEGSPASVRKELVVPDRPVLADGAVNYQGQPVAVVVATDRYAAHDAIRQIEVTYDRQEAVTHPDSALEDDAPVIHGEAQDNVAFDWEVGDEGSVREAFEEADHVVSVQRDHQRIIGNSIEPRGAIAKYTQGQLTVAMSSQVPHRHQLLLSHVLGLPESRIRVWTPDIGGGFGIKSKYYSEEILTAWCAIRVERPVKWLATRTESFQADCQGRAHVGDAELALNDSGEILALRVDDRKDLGAYVQRAAPSVNTGSYATLLSSQYTIPDIFCRVRGVFTNLTPTDAYRGSSRPEGCYIIERLVREAAVELDMDPVKLRRKNLISPDAFPYQTPVLAEYDSGDYETALEKVCDLVEYDTLRERQAALREDERYLGIGMACFVEPAGSSPPGGGSTGPGIEAAHIESSRVSFYPDGSVSAYCGTSDQGQGHETTYAQILSDTLGVEYDEIEIHEGDTDQAAQGTGTHSSRSVIMAGSALDRCASKIIDKARQIAAYQLEADPKDIEFEDGEFSVAGSTEHVLRIEDIAKESYRASDLPANLEPGLTSETYYGSEGKTWPYGTHVAIVEVDPETGDVTLERYAAVDDCGVQINPGLVEGQIEGGVVQGIGQALHEGAVYDENGTLVTGSFQDYAMPRAKDIPDIEVDHTITPSPRNPLGVKGTGEAGAVGAPTAVLNAVLDALEPFGVDELPLPMTPETVWNELARTRP